MLFTTASRVGDSGIKNRIESFNRAEEHQYCITSGTLYPQMHAILLEICTDLVSFLPKAVVGSRAQRDIEKKIKSFAASNGSHMERWSDARRLREEIRDF